VIKAPSNPNDKLEDNLNCRLCGSWN